MATTIITNAQTGEVTERELTAEEIAALAPPVLTPEQLDAIAERVADELLEQDAKMKALGLVIADLVEQAFNVTPAVARNQVKSRFLAYYRGLIG